MTELLASVEEGARRLAAGEMIIVCDREDRECEGDLVMAAEFATPESVNFMITYGRGLVCVPMDPERADNLAIPMQPRRNQPRSGTPFMVGVDAADGIGSGVSAADRARTARTLADPLCQSQDLRMPGHVFPLKASYGGVLKRDGHTEATVDLLSLAGLDPAGVICEIMNDDGTMARLPELKPFADRHDLPIMKVQQLVEHRKLYSAPATTVGGRAMSLS